MSPEIYLHKTLDTKDKYCLNCVFSLVVSPFNKVLQLNIKQQNIRTSIKYFYQI